MDPHDIDLNELEPRVLDWINADPDPKTAAELTDLLARANCDAPDMATGSRDEALLELHDRFAGFLEFGTAGLRGTLGGGPNRMNRAVVIKAAAGLGDYLSEQLREVEDIGVVIGYDARHRCVDFARDTAAVLTAQGKKVFLIDSPVSTPILAYAIRDLAAEAGVMVTASHNPPQDNGYKVYLGGRLTAPEATGVQIVSPADSEIAAAIAKIGPARQVTRAESGWQVLGPEVATAYLASLKDLDAGPGTQQVADQRAGLRIVYTPLHGVGGTLAQAALTQAGFLDVHVVAQQEHPDPDFPTVIFPNPEEPGAMDLALGLAEEVAADIIIANDPDADRCAVAARDSETGEFRMLEGDEVGALLAERIAGDALLAERIAGDALLAKRFAEGASVPPQSASVPAESASAPPKTPPALASSVVSSRLIEKIAAAHGLRHEVTLTGFKWISRVPGLIFGYEEALGYCVAPEVVRDKDGISAAVLLAGLAAELKETGASLFDALDDLARMHDLYATDQLSARFVDRGAITATVDQLLLEPPKTLVGSRVVEAENLDAGFRGLPPTAGMWLRTEDDTRVVVRPSGTEPKLKCYLEVVAGLTPEASSAEVKRVRQQAGERLAQLKNELAELLGLR